MGLFDRVIDAIADRIASKVAAESPRQPKKELPEGLAFCKHRPVPPGGPICNCVPGVCRVGIPKHEPVEEAVQEAAEPASERQPSSRPVHWLELSQTKREDVVLVMKKFESFVQDAHGNTLHRNFQLALEYLADDGDPGRR